MINNFFLVFIAKRKTHSECFLGWCGLYFKIVSFKEITKLEHVVKKVENFQNLPKLL